MLDIAADARRIRLDGIAAVADRRQRLELDGDARRGVLREVTIIRDRHGDGLADVSDLAAGERQLRPRRPDGRVWHQHRDLHACHRLRQIVGG